VLNPNILFIIWIAKVVKVFGFVAMQYFRLWNKLTNEGEIYKCRPLK
jgi:hypothetical protein